MIKTDRKTQILYAAESVFAEKGYFAASIADIIKQAGIARGTFYLYFNSKKSVFDALLDDFLTSLDASIKRIEISIFAPPPLEQLKRNMIRVFTLLQKKKNLTRILLSYATGVDVDFEQKLNDFYNSVLSSIEIAIQLGIEMEIIRICNVTIASYCVLGVVKEVANYLINVNENDIDISELADEVIQFGLKGLLIE